MCATFTDDDIGKLVERTDGKVIGTIASLETATARVEPAPDVVDTLKARFGGDEVGGPFILHESDVREISETRVHLVDGFARANAPTPSGDTTTRSGTEDDHDAGSTASSETGKTNHAAEEAASGGVGPFNTPFQIGAAVVSALSFLLAVSFAWFGYQGMNLLTVGPELNIISGMAGLMLTAFLGTVALIAAIYMEPGFDH
ncbi:hypothetical protein [Natronorubrum aibiense]|uniref:Uncharacterized protein n=1 Tax=Natronorubrum aibiense TaxID=348826 RepID=A0A5P9P0R0_9EURY|nr:hypothetical protein [Natronorubrum aibiense]QFU81616.1 hypothetical protein GCU68_03090 [Natronorubrum aibiense]